MSHALSLVALSGLGWIFVTTTYELERGDFLYILAHDKNVTMLELVKIGCNDHSAVAQNMSNALASIVPILEQDPIKETIITGIRYL